MHNLFSMPDETIFSGRTSDTTELLKAWAGTSLAFALAQMRGRVFDDLPGFLLILALSALTCGAGFVVHELAHRVLARSYRAEAHFVANNGMLLLSILIALLPVGFFFAAPGAVWHRGLLTARQSGLIALAGPVSNLVLAVLFVLAGIALILVVPDPPFWLYLLCVMGYGINSWLGLFNMIPAGPFDGARVLAWNAVVFGVTVAVGIVLVFLVPDPFRLILSIVP